MLSIAVVDLGAEERELLARLRNGEEGAFETFAEAYVPALFRFASAHLDRDRDLVPDVVQSVVTRAIDKLDGFRGDAPLLAWLCACCRNEIAGIYRQRGRRPAEISLDAPANAPVKDALATHAEGPELLLLARETRTLVHVALDRLPSHYAHALEWKYLEAIPVIEIARRLELTPKAAESLLTRARVAFRGAILDLAAVPDGLQPPQST
jgi:RNA polymerase sigma-70 factor (ECF subfamily)